MNLVANNIHYTKKSNIIVEPAKDIDFFHYYQIIRKLHPETSLIESNCAYNAETANYSFIGVIADEKVFEKNGKYFRYFFDTEEIIEANWLEVVDEWYSCKKLSKQSMFAPGVIGYIGYEERHSFENLSKILNKDTDLPSVYFVHYKLILIQEKKNGNMFWCYDDEDGLVSYHRIINNIECCASKNHTKNADDSFRVLGDLVNDFSEREYLSIIEETIQHIKNGDIFQANITMRTHGKYIGNPFSLYEIIRKQQQNPFFAYFDFSYPLISTSPERFIKIEDKKIETNPIKGTVKATIDGVDQGANLTGSVKNNAENTMITDLMRNDIGRVCKKDSVIVEKLCQLKQFNALYHLESIVTGEIRDGLSLSDILKATFPGGSITGAPKIKSMNLIEELEKKQRGPYTGMLTFFNNHGYLDSAIGIRIIYFEDNHFYIHSGGGIVAKSDPLDELNELKIKIASLKDLLSQCNVLKKQRDEIESIDSHLFNLLNKRFGLVTEVAELKKKHQIPILQKERVSQLKKQGKVIENKNHNLPKGFSDRLYTFLVSESMDKEDNIMRAECQSNLKLNVAANFEDGFLDQIAKYPEVKVVFGKMKFDFIGGGVESNLLKDISYDDFIAYVQKTQSLGMNFNYVINAPAMGNEEFTLEGQKKLDELLSKLNQLDIEAVTVANPFLIQYIKRKFNNLPIKASSIMMIDSVQKAQFVKNLGADIIVLDSLLTNRDFVNLKKIRNEISGEIEIMLNNNCIMNCPMLTYHQTYLSNNSRTDKREINTDYCYLNCSCQRIENPINMIRSEWIRPEDLHFYEEIGYNRFKITDRSTPADILIRRIKAYIEHSYDGNLLDLIIHYGYKNEVSQHEYYDNIYIDNKALNGFLDWFVHGNCDGKNCVSNCNHCYQYAQKSIKIDELFRNKIVASKKQKIRNLLSKD